MGRSALCLMWLVSVVMVSSAWAGPKPRQKAATALAKAAEKGYQNARTQYRFGRAKIDAIHRWSVRLLNAKRRLVRGKKRIQKLYLAHHKRMRSLAQQVKLLVRQGRVTRGDLLSADYFVKEAALWRLTRKR